MARDRRRLAFDNPELEQRGTIEVKGKGPMATWLLDGANDQS